MQCDILSAGKKVGFLSAQRQGLYTRFYGEVETKEVVKIYAVFDKGVCALGIPVPEKGKMVLRVSLPSGKLPGGGLLYGQLHDGGEQWEYFSGGVLGGILYPEGLRNGMCLSFPWNVGQKLPAEEAMLFYEYCPEGGHIRLKLDQDGNVLTGAV